MTDCCTKETSGIFNWSLVVFFFFFSFLSTFIILKATQKSGFLVGTATGRPCHGIPGETLGVSRSATQLMWNLGSKQVINWCPNLLSLKLLIPLCLTDSSTWWLTPDGDKSPHSIHAKGTTQLTIELGYLPTVRTQHKGTSRDLLWLRKAAVLPRTVYQNRQWRYIFICSSSLYKSRIIQLIKIIGIFP